MMVPPGRGCAPQARTFPLIEGRTVRVSAPISSWCRESGDSPMANADGEINSSKGKTSVSKSKTSKDANLRLRKAQRAAILLKQASDPTRLQIMLTLADGEKHVGALCEELKQT